MATLEKRLSDEGEITYRVKVRIKGHPPQTATFKRRTDAKQWAQKIESDIRRGRHFDDVMAKKYTLAEAIDKYNDEVLSLKPNSTKNQKHYLKWWKKSIGSYRLVDINAALIAESRQILLNEPNQFGKTKSVSTANRYCTALGHLLNVAIKEWEWIQYNPFNRIKKFKEPRGRVRFLSELERKRLLEACKESNNPYLYIIVVLALSTGARKMELLTLTWADIDLTRQSIILHETKNDERRVLPLKSYALELIKKLSSNSSPDSDYIFPAKGKNQPIDIRTAWENALIKAGIKDFRFHDLRHSTASYLAMNGANLAEIAGVLGHKTLQMVKRYSHLSEPHTASVVERMNNKIFG